MTVSQFAPNIASVPTKLVDASKIFNPTIITKKQEKQRTY